MKKTILGMLVLLAGCWQTAQAQESNAAYDCIMTRTSIRQYQDKPVEAAKVEKLLRAGMAAPTAVNRQPWHFIVLDTRERIDRLVAANPRAGMLKRAPLAIVVCGDMQKALQGDAQAYWVQDASAATENILLAAHALGLGTVWTGTYPIKDRVKATSGALALPEHIVPLCTIVIGYPAEQPAPKNKWKPENVSYGTYGGQK